jgi:aspartate kinase
MARLVKKFGGTSVADHDRIRAVADRVKRAHDDGHEVAVVVSAMAGVTNDLVDKVSTMSRTADAREYDVVVSAGEQVSAGLTAIALQELGVPARSWLGWQLPFLTDNAHGKARIADVITDDIVTGFGAGEVAVIAGFQGIADGNRVTTFGRGGSDTTAVALAKALDADRCDIYTDVEGVYTSDPRIVTRARKIDRITFEEMLEMASVGAKVLQTRAVELAMKHGVELQVLSSFVDVPGTFIVNEEQILEQELVSGVTYSRDEAKISLLSVSDRPGVAASIFGPLADANINVDMIVQNISAEGTRTDMTFTVTKGDLDAAVKVIESRRGDIDYTELRSDPDVVKVSVIGVGMRSHAGVASRMFRTLAERGINIAVISTSEIKVSVLIEEAYAELALRALHSAYGLDSE